MKNSQHIIEVNSLTKHFRSRGNSNPITTWFKPEWQEFTAVDNVSFNIKRGEAVAFLGPNGAGKTTTTKMLSGIMHPTSGEVSVLDFTPWKRDPAYLSRIGLVMGNKTGMNWDLTARQSYQLLKEIYAVPDIAYQKQLQLLGSMLNIEKVFDTKIRRLSLGERMKVELAGAILHEPEILFLDEPTIGLDIEAKATVRDFLIDLRKKKDVTVILTSHDMDDIDHVCERVLVINEGSMIFDGSLEKLNKSYEDIKYVRLHFESPPTKKLLSSLGSVQSQKGHSAILAIDKKKLGATMAKIAKIKDLQDMSVESVPLEKIVGDLFQAKKS